MEERDQLIDEIMKELRKKLRHSSWGDIYTSSLDITVKEIIKEGWDKLEFYHWRLGGTSDYARAYIIGCVTGYYTLMEVIKKSLLIPKITDPKKDVVCGHTGKFPFGNCTVKMCNYPDCCNDILLHEKQQNGEKYL